MHSDSVEDDPIKTMASKCPMKDSLNKVESRSAVRGYVSDDPQLPERELAFYLVAMLSIVIYAGYGFYVTYGHDMTQNLPVQALKRGWMRDYKDIVVHPMFEQATNNWPQLTLASAGFLIVSKASLAFAPMNVHHLACSIYTLLMISIALSSKAAFALVFLYTVCLSLAYFSNPAVWILPSALLYSFSRVEVSAVLLSALEIQDDKLNTFSAMSSYLMCRLISLGHTLRTEVSEQPCGFRQYLLNNVPLSLAYTFYMPYTWSGPILTFDAFRKQLQSRGRRVEIDSNTISVVAWRVCRMVLWYYVLEMIYHYLPTGSYLLTLQPDVPIVYKHMSFSIYIHGQSFMLLCIQYFGWPAVLALLDGVELFHWPDCISWVYSYSIMWRVFDRGLFSVIQEHIYRPLGGSRRGPLRQFLALVASFLFVCIFHGDSASSRAWVTLNVVQLVMERLMIFVYYKYLRCAVMQSGEVEDDPIKSSASKCPMKDSLNKFESRSAVRSYVSDDPQLPKRELAFYLVAMLSIVIYAGYGFYVTYGLDMTRNLPAEALKPGWIRKYKDIGVQDLFERASNNWPRLVLASIGFLLPCGFRQYLLNNVPLSLAYTFYMPYTWSGPILTFDAFRKQLQSRGRRVEIDSNTISVVAWRVCRMVLWYYVLEMIYHYLPTGSYLLTLQPDVPIVYKHMSFCVYLNGQSFMLLYIQYYGWPAVLALLDGVELFHWPDCISWVYSYSIMWRVFDRGLFSVIQEHIYRPLGGSRRGPLRQIFALVVCFGFICAFHGDTANSRAWVTLNVVQLVMERLITFVYYKHMRCFITKYLSPQNEKRLTGYVIAWNMTASCGIIYFFLGGTKGFIIFPELLLLRSMSSHTPLWHLLTFQFGTYCAVQMGRYFEVKLKPALCNKAKKAKVTAE
uniref:Protein-cysteine N-palmitoyltransferase HHAT n=1 Tax=Macrostomum lignano TaxID=282301 RepID=A0A1I8H5K6_9PLAT